MAPSSSGQLQYQWSRINNEGEEKIENEECFKNSDSKTLIIDGFESKYAGIYQCVISTSSRPVVSMSVEVELDLPGERFARCNDYVYKERARFARSLLDLVTNPAHILRCIQRYCACSS
jgi:hypothetical protein